MVTRLLSLVASLLALTVLGGCAPTLHGGGNVDRWKADLRACNLETLGFGFIPDFGVTKDFHQRKCMKQRSWVKTVDLTGWAWIGAGGTLQLYQFPNGDRQLVFLCPSRKSCETVRASTEPSEIVTWMFRAWPGEVSREIDVFLVGDQASCELVRQRDVAQGISVTAGCEGPRYFERAIEKAPR